MPKASANSKSALTHLPVEELLSLNAHLHDMELQREQYAHALTRIEMVKHAAEAAALRAQQEAAQAREGATKFLSQTRDEFNAASARLKKLTEDIRSRHNLTTKHAIDAQTGAITLPEG